MAHEIEKFFGCYLLVSANPKYKGRTYIGFTVDPNRRINQHNTGKEAGGAWRTSGKGPWDMVLSIHGFPNMVSALQFEWAWQHPGKSQKLKNVYSKHKKLRGFKHKFAIVSEMLRTGPWCRLPLTIRWLNQDFVTEFDSAMQPPVHMPIVYGPVKAVKPKGKKQTTESDCEQPVGTCCLCQLQVKANIDSVRCLNPECNMMSHMTCLASGFLRDEPQSLLPVSGECPQCAANLLWGDLIRQQQGCYQSAQEEEIETHDDNHWSSQLSGHITDGNRLV